MSDSRPSGPVTTAVHRYLTEGASPPRQAAALGLGVFIGCLPVYGLHLPLCLAAGWALGLNRLKMYVAANVSNPLFSPFLIFLSVQAGAWLDEGAFHALSFEAFRSMDPWVFGRQLVLGGGALGAALGLSVFALTFLVLRRPSRGRAEASVLEEAANRYLVNGIRTWSFAFWKLRLDPMYRALVSQGLVPGAGRIVDVGCGLGLLFSLLRTAEAAGRRGGLPETWPRPAGPLDLLGIDRDRSTLDKARRAFSHEATFDAPGSPLPSADAVLFLDVLHYMAPADQERVLDEAAAALLPGGVLVVREADAGAGLAFYAVRVSERGRAVMRGRFRERHHYRTGARWKEALDALGLRTALQPMGKGTPFANFLLRGVKPSEGEPP